ncbi:MAG: TatD family nuclease-associated radical SAM protein [Planctomycetota bacterium]|nr:TatD family nuclease-associated radical SAM protein [Planctomycetota bacterium]
MHLVDTHCHLQRHEFDTDREAVIGRAADKGMMLITCATTVAEAEQCLSLAAAHQAVYAAIGIHPNDTAAATAAEVAALRSLAARAEKSGKKIAALGEIGLDYHWERAAPEQQRRILDLQLELALELKRPVILHARQSADDLRAAIRHFCAAGGSAVWHCFCGSRQEMQKIKEDAETYSIRLGIGGLATFEDQKSLRQILPLIPDRLLLVESDAPFLVPRPRRFDRNEPLACFQVAEELARLRGVTLADIARITTRNACEVFGLPWPEIYKTPGIAYVIRNSLYLSLTNDCTNDCVFCGRRRSFVVKGHDIRLEREPTAQEVIAAMGDIAPYDEVVFCGFGEPTLRLEVLKEVAAEIKRRGKVVRLNTNGLANLHHGRDIVPELKGMVDVVSVSLNTADPDQYLDLCRPRFGRPAYEALCDFVRACVAAGLRTICTAVAAPGIDLAAVEKKARALGAEFRARSFVDVG